MCGRAYATYTDDELVFRYLNKRPVTLPGFKANYNIAPTQLVPVVLERPESEGRAIELLRWGLVPFWAKDETIGSKMINARAETVAEKPSFRNAFSRRRCVIPLSGFYEWKREKVGAKEVKRPFRIWGAEEPILSVAGLWEAWKPEGEDQLLHTFAIITTEANKFMSRLHDRMPVLLARTAEAEWLDPTNDNEEALTKLLKPCPDKWLQAVEVSTLVNSPRNNSSELLEPVESKVL